MSDFLSLFPEVEQQYGLPTGYLERVARVESRMDPTAQNPNSSAGGLFQFIDRTARQYNLANRFDPRQATDAAARLARDNAATLRNVLGRDPTAGELYLAHQQGAGGAARLLRNPDAPAAGVLGNDAFRLNGGRPGMTAAEFAQRWIGKIDGQSASPQATATARGPITPPDTMTGGSGMNEQTAEKPVPATVGGLGGLGGFQPLAGGQFGEMLQMIGMSLLSSPGNAPLQNLPALAMATQQRRTAAEEREYNRRRQETLDSANLDDRRSSTEMRRLQMRQMQAEIDRQARDAQILSGAPVPGSPASPAPVPAPVSTPSPAVTPPADTVAPVSPSAQTTPAQPAASPVAAPATPAAAPTAAPQPSSPTDMQIQRIDRAISDPRLSPQARQQLIEQKNKLLSNFTFQTRPDGSVIRIDKTDNSVREIRPAQNKIADEARAREVEAERQGLRRGTPEFQNYVLTGRFRDSPELSATDRKAIMEAEDQTPIVQNTIGILNRALELNPRAYSGFGAGALGTIGTSGIPGASTFIDPERAKATREFNQLMSGQAIEQMSQTLKGATTDREMAQFVEILGNPATPPEIRERTINRMKALAERQLQLQQLRIQQLRGRDYYRPGGGSSTAPAPAQGQAPQQATPEAPQQQAAPSAPQVGEVRRGYRYKGGNPADQSSWERVQ